MIYLFFKFEEDREIEVKNAIIFIIRICIVQENIWWRVLLKLLGLLKYMGALYTGAIYLWE